MDIAALKVQHGKIRSATEDLRNMYKISIPNPRLDALIVTLEEASSEMDSILSSDDSATSATTQVPSQGPTPVADAPKMKQKPVGNPVPEAAAVAAS